MSADDSSCGLIYRVPKHDALILTSVTFNTYTVPAVGSGYFTGLFAGSCGTYFLDNDPGAVGETTVPLNPGYALKGGTGIYVASGFGVISEVYINGYLVSPKAVSSSHLPALAHVGAMQRR